MSAKLWTEEQFNCPVCLDLPSDPVTIPCGHSYCMACIADFWTTEKTPGVYSCPECRQTFSPKPQLCRNTMLAEAMEQLRKGTLSSSARDTIRRAHGDSVRANAKAGRASSANGPRRSKAQLSAAAVPCDQCLDGGREAVKTCLVCMASFCETHLKPHQTNAKLKGHELIAPTGQLTEKICTQHKYLQEFYCRPCQMYICWLCTSNAHKGHDSVSTQTQRTEKQKEVEVAQTQNQQRLQEREKELKDMKKVLETLTRSSEKVQEEVETVLGELQQSVQRLQDLLGEVMLSTGQEKLSETQDVVQKLEAEISQLKKRETDTRDLIRSQDNIYFLQNFQALVSPVEVADLGSVSVTPDVSFDPVRATILELRERVEEMCNQELNKINRTVFDMVPFTVTKKDDQKMGAFLKLFAGIGPKPTNPNRVPPTMPSVSVRGPGYGARRPAETRNQDQPRAGRGAASSPRPPQRQTTEDRDEDDSWSMSSMRSVQRQRRDEREIANSTPQPQTQSRQSRQRTEDRDDDTRSVSSVRPRNRQRQNNREDGDRDSRTQTLPQTPQRQTQETEQSDTWSISSLRPRERQRREEREPAARENTTSAQNGQPREQPRQQSDNWSLSSLRPRDRQRRESEQSEKGERWSLSSLLPRNRRKREERGTVRELTPDDPPSSSGLWDAQPSQVNPSLFLDSPTHDGMTSPAFPALREIDLDSIQAPEPRTRDEFLQYACALILDPNSAHRRLVLSEGNTVATVQASVQVCADSPQRFDGWTQVVCVGPLAGERCYWEVEWRGRGSSLGVALASMPRKGPDSRSGLGYNAQSWSLELSDMCCAALHNNQKQDIPVTYSPRVGLFLDRAAQTLAFYAVDDELSLLHTFRSAALSQPLYAAFGVGCGLGVGLDFASGQFSAQTDSIKICPI